MMNHDLLQPGTTCLFLSGVNPTPNDWMHGKVIAWRGKSAELMPDLVDTHYCIEVSPVHSGWPRIVYRKHSDVKSDKA